MSSIYNTNMSEMKFGLLGNFFSNLKNDKLGKLYHKQVTVKVEDENGEDTGETFTVHTQPILRTIVQVIKRPINFVADFFGRFDEPTSLLRHFHHIVPLAAFFNRNGPAKLAPLINLVEGAGQIADLTQPINDINYVANGGLQKDWVKSFYISILAHAVLAPSNLLGIVHFSRQVGFSNFKFLTQASRTVGSFQFFGAAPWLASQLQKLPLVHYVPSVTNFVAKPFGLVAATSVLPACVATLCVAYSFFCLDFLISKRSYYQTKIDDVNTAINIGIPTRRDEISKLLKGIESTKGLIQQLEEEQEKLDGAGEDDDGYADLEKQVRTLNLRVKELEREFAELPAESRELYRKLSSHQHKYTIRKIDFAANVTKLAINIIFLGTLTHVAAFAFIASSVPVMAALGFVAMGFVGTKMYLEWKHKNFLPNPISH